MFRRRNPSEAMYDGDTWEFAELEECDECSITFSHRLAVYGEKWQLLKYLGNNGYELVGVAFAVGSTGDDCWRYVFKRPRQLHP